MTPSTDQVKVLREALTFYATQQHFVLHDADVFDTISGEPQNWQEDESNTIMFEDGSVAKAALAATERAAIQPAGEAVAWEYEYLSNGDNDYGQWKTAVTRFKGDAEGAHHHDRRNVRALAYAAPISEGIASAGVADMVDNIRIVPKGRYGDPAPSVFTTAFGESVQDGEATDPTRNQSRLDSDYFSKKLKLIVRDISHYTPQEMARELVRLAMTASEADAIKEAAPVAAIQPAGDAVRDAALEMALDVVRLA